MIPKLNGLAASPSVQGCLRCCRCDGCEERREKKAMGSQAHAARPFVTSTRNDRHRHSLTRQSPISFGPARLFLTSYTPDRVRHALPVVPFTLGNEGVQRFENFLLTKVGHELFSLA